MYHLLSLLLITGSPVVVYGFQFMKGWKMPTYDPQEEATQTKFGDKSECGRLLLLLAAEPLPSLCKNTLTSYVVVVVAFLSIYPFVQNWSSLPVPARVLVARQRWPCCAPGTTMWSERCEST
jgi:hypothetical protein